MTPHDTPEAVDAMVEEMHFTVGDLPTEISCVAAAAMLRRLHARVVDAEDQASRAISAAENWHHEARRMREALATARADALREARKIASDAIPTAHPPLTDHYGAHVAGERMVAEWIIKRLDTLIQPTTGET